MSDYEDMLEDEDIEEVIDGYDTEIEPEDVFSMVMINKNRKVKVTVGLEDDDGDDIPLKDVITELLAYIKDQLNDKEKNQFAEQIMPLMSQAVVSGLGRMIGLRATAFHLSNEMTRAAFIQMMCVGLLLLKFVQQKELKICTFEEDVTDEEIEEIERRSKAHDTATLAALAGHDPKAVLAELQKQGLITEDDLRDMINGRGAEDDILESDEPDEPDNEDE